MVLFSKQIDINNSNKLETSSNKISKDSLASLFSYDWFLIELGKILISADDEDLVNILCLNREINERATIIFRQHFLNFNLQKEIFKLIKLKEFNQIQQLFETKALSLNPNIQCKSFERKKQKRGEAPLKHCVHDEKVRMAIPDYLKDCDCAISKAEIPLFIMASRLGLNSLVKSLIFHHRLSVSDPDFIENIYEVRNFCGKKKFVCFVFFFSLSSSLYVSS